MLVAVSGGADSTALLAGLAALARERGLEIHAAHLNHRLRGRAADADQAFVEDLCARLGVTLHVARWNTPLRMRRRRLSGENGLRVLRREFLESAAARIGAGCIATAHTADDQLETVLLRLMRGTGLMGLGGMRPRSGPWIKPLLGSTRADIEADLRRASLEWREDASNLDPVVARNRVRHGVVPALIDALHRPPAGSAGARARSSLARRVGALAAELRQAEAALRRWIRPLARATTRDRARGLCIPVSRFDRYPVAARRALLRVLWRGVAPPGVGLTASHLAQIDRLRAKAKGPVPLPAGFTAERRSGSIRIGKGRIQQAIDRGSPLRRGDPPSPLQVPGCAERRGLRVWSRWMTQRRALGGISENVATREYFAADGIRGSLEVRLARADETFIPFGRRRPTRVREFLRKLPARSRAASPTVLADDSGILWVIGVRRSSRAPVQPNTQRVLCVHAERHD